MEQNPQILLRKTRTAGIMNLIGAVLRFLVLVAFIVCLYGGLLVGGTGEGENAEENIGYAFGALVFLPVLLLCFVPICIADIVWQTVLSVKFLHICAEERKGKSRLFSQTPYVVSLILKILSVPLFAVAMLFLPFIGDSAATGAFTIGGFLLASYLIVTLVAENKSKKERLFRKI